MARATAAAGPDIRLNVRGAAEPLSACHYCLQKTRMTVTDVELRPMNAIVAVYTIISNRGRKAKALP